MGEVIVITSGKGGVGKTTSTANLSIALAKMGKSVIAIDTDIGLRNLDVVMGLENQIVYNPLPYNQSKNLFPTACYRRLSVFSVLQLSFDIPLPWRY